MQVIMFCSCTSQQTHVSSSLPVYITIARCTLHAAASASCAKAASKADACSLRAFAVLEVLQKVKCCC
jgi:hypothetical protein